MRHEKKTGFRPERVTPNGIPDSISELTHEATAVSPVKDQRLLTPKQVAERLAVSVDWVQAHATHKEPRIGHIRAGKLIRFTPEQVQEFILRQAVIHES